MASSQQYFAPVSSNYFQDVEERGRVAREKKVEGREAEGLWTVDRR